MKSLLLGGVAVAAIATGGFGAGSAAAQCTTSDSTVTCSGATADTQAQQAITGATPPNLTLVVNQGATIGSVQRQISVPNVPTAIFLPPNGFVTSPAFTGTVSIDNAGVIGTSPTLTTDLLVAGPSRFVGVNSGVINGSVLVGSQFGGTSTAGFGSFANTGTVTGTVSLQGSGDQSYTGNGAIRGGSFPFNGLIIASRASTTTSTSDGTQTTAVTGGTATATIDGVLRSTETQPTSLRVIATGIGGATVVIGGATGGVTVASLDANTVSRNTSSFQGGNFSSTSNFNSQAVGGAATLIVNPAATVNGETSVRGLTSATATVNGTLAPAGQNFGPLMSVTANAADTTFAQSQSQSGSGGSFASSFQSASTSTSRGGTASVAVAAGASVAGGVSVSGGSTASATVDGSIGGTSFPNNLSVSAGAADTVSSFSSRSDSTGGSSSGSGSTTQRGGTASVSVGVTGTVVGAVQVTGISNAVATIAGTVGSTLNTAGVSVVTQGTDSTSSSSSSSSATTGSTNTSTETRTARAGAAGVTIASTARIVGGVGVSGGTSATASIDGAVGSTSNPFSGVFVSTGGNDSTTTTTASAPFAGTFTQVRESASTARGGAASVTVGTTGSVIGSVSASSTRGAVTATLAGRAGVANPQNFSPTPSLSAIASGADTRGTSTSASNRNAFSNSSTAVGGQATATVLAGGVMSGDVVARGDTGATIVNAGTVVRALRLTAGAANTTNSRDSSGSSTTTGGVTTSINRLTFIDTSVPVAADGGVTNTGTAGSVAATATGNLAFRNDGIVIGNVGLTAGGTASTSESSSQRVTTTTPAAGGGMITVATNTNLDNTAAQAIGGNVVATYNGIVGTNPIDPGQTQSTEVRQFAVGSNTATVAGLVLGTVNSSTGGANTSANNSTVTTTTTEPRVGTGTAAATETTVVANRSSRTVVGGPSSVIVSGAVRNDGTGSSGVTVQAATGSASALVNGGTIAGGLVITAGQGLNSNTSLDRTTSSARTASITFSSFIEQSSTQTSSTLTRLAGGTAAATLTGATVGSVQMSGVGTGAGSLAATAGVDAASTVGTFNVAAGGLDRRDDQTDTLANGTRTIVTTRTDSVSALAGNARADVAGRIGAAAVTSQGGNATLNLTGVATDTVSVGANAIDRVVTTTQTLAVTSPQGFPALRQAGQTTASITTARGGVATLAIAGSGVVQGAGTNTVGGAVSIDGFGGSVLTVATGSRLLGNDGGTVRVVGTAVNATATTTSSFDPANGAFTGATTRQTVTSVAGPAGITNAGVIGAPTTYFSAPVAVRAESIGGATIANTGQVYGDIAAAGLGERRDITSVQTPASTTTPTTVTTTTTFTPIGAAARITNAGVISGRVEVVGGTGAISNTGVIRDAVQLGAGVRNYTNTLTSTRVIQQDGTAVTTSVTSPATPAATLFGQSLTLNQNGLVLGGVRVEGATTTDPVNGAPIRTSTIDAAVNLNAGSITLGDVTGQQDATGRLTRTAVTLSGDGFLGAGPTLQAVQSTGAVRFAAVPNYATFAAIDRALGTVGTAGFTPAVTLASGSRISGVDSVTKSGSGAFTIVGAPLLRAAGSTSFTIDAPIVRVASGELQLGVAGVDPATGQGVFGIRGTMQNDGVLVVGRRIASGTSSGVQGVTLSVTGNVTQSAGGTLVIAAPLQPALQTAPALATTPSFLNVDGALSLGGVLSIAVPQGIYVTGAGPDFASVGGAFTSTATVSAFNSPFVTFGIATRAEGGRTIASINVTRTPFSSVATNGNAVAAGSGLQAAIPAAIAAGAGSDLAAVIGRLDTGSAVGAAGTLDELGQASFYGSLAAVSITRSFGEVSDVLAGTDADRERPVSLWMRMAGSASRIRGDAGTGARRLTGNNFGAIVGLDVTSGGVSVGVGVGPGWTDAAAGIGRGRANGWMVGAYAAGRFGALSLAGQGVAGWTDWNASRTLPSFGRYATTSFDQREIRLNGRAALDLSIGEVSLSPFAGVEWRQWRFDGFSERNAGALGVSGGRVSDSVLSPEAGARIAATTGMLRAFVEGAYVFQGNIETDRTFSLVGAPSTFTVRGVTPGDFGRIGSGLETDIGRGSFFVRGDVWAGGGNRLGAVHVGARIRL